MAPNRVPHYVLFVNALPTTVSGKVQKFKLRTIAAKALGLQDLETHLQAAQPGDKQQIAISEDE